MGRGPDPSGQRHARSPSRHSPRPAPRAARLWWTASGALAALTLWPYGIQTPMELELIQAQPLLRLGLMVASILVAVGCVSRR